MFGKRYRITLLFNANKAYDRQVIQGIGEYFHTSQCSWDIFIADDFRYQINQIKSTLSDGIIADFDDITMQHYLNSLTIPVIGVGGSYHNPEDYPAVHYVATDNHALVKAAFLHLKEKGINQFAFYGLPPDSQLRWSQERENAFLQLIQKENYPYSIYHGMTTVSEHWDLAQSQLAQWLQSLPAQTGIIAVTDARARHILQVCDHLNIPIPEQLCVIGIDNEEITRYLCRVPLSSVVQGAKQMGYQAARLLQQLLDNKQLPLQRILIPPMKVIGRCSTDYRSLQDPAVLQAMHFIRQYACKGIKVDQVLSFIKISRSNLEKKFKQELSLTIHEVIYQEKLQQAKTLLTSTDLSINEIAHICGYPSLQYFYSIFKKECNMTPKKYRVHHGHTEHYFY